MLSAQGASSRLHARFCCVQGAFGQRHLRMMLPASLSFRISLLVPDAVRPERTTRAAARRCLRTRNQAVATRHREPVTKVKVSFKLPYRCHFGQNVYLVGAGDELGNWNVHESKPMKWSDGDVWMCEVELASGKHHQLEYKYVVRNSDGRISAWKPGSNCKVLVKDLPEVPEKISVFDAWDGAFHDVQIMLHRPCPHDFSKHSKSKIPSDGPSEGNPSGGQSYPSDQGYWSAQGFSSDSTAYGFDSQARASDAQAYSSDTISSELFTTTASATSFSESTQLSRSTLVNSSTPLSSAGFTFDSAVVRNLEPSSNPPDSATYGFDTTSSSTFTPPNLTSSNIASSSTTTALFTSDRDMLNPTPSNLSSLPNINDSIESFYPQTPSFSNQAASSNVSSNSTATPNSDESSYQLDPLEEIRSYAERLASFTQQSPSSPGITDQWPPSTSSSDSSSSDMGVTGGVTPASVLSYRSRGSRRNRFGPLDFEEGVNDSIVDVSFGAYQQDPIPSAPTSFESQSIAQTVSSLQTESVSADKVPSVVDTGSLARESARTESPSTAIVEPTSMSSSSSSSGEEEVESPTLSQLAMVLSERNAVESAMKRALQEIDSHLEESLDLGGKMSDPAHETRLEMDRKLAAANMRVNAYTKVLNACPPVKELKAAIELEKRDAQSQSK